MINQELRKVLAMAYRCPAFDDVCKSTMRWEPQRGHVPRGFCGAEGPLERVRLVLVFAEPGDPHAAETHSSSPEFMIENTATYTRSCFANGTDQFHRNVRFILDQCWPRLSFDDQMKCTWITESVLCSAMIEGGSVPKPSASECRRRYLEEQLRLLSNAHIIALGSKAQQRLQGISNVINAFAAAPPGCNQKAARPSWISAAETFKQRIK